ncbi:hypothetical protein LCGC14_2446840, partial [marine sediment metagenome]
MSGSRVVSENVKRWPRRLALGLAAMLVTLLALNGGSSSAADNVHGAVYDWARANPEQDVPVLIQTDGDSDAVADFILSSGGTVQREFEIIPAVETDVSPAFISALAGHPSVAWISLDAPVVSTGGSDAVDTRYLTTAYPFAVNAPEVWNGDVSRTGRGVTVAVVDTGITNNNKDFKDGKKSRVLFDVAIETVAEGASFPAFLNDDAFIAAAVERGTAIGDAREYTFVGCG